MRGFVAPFGYTLDVVVTEEGRIQARVVRQDGSIASMHDISPLVLRGR